MSRVVLGDVAIEHKESCKVNRGMYPTVGLEHMRSEEITLTKWDNGGDSSFTKMFRKGNVLFGRRRAYLKKAVIAPFDGICSGDIIVIEAIPNRILPELLPLVIQNDALFDYAVSKSAGSLSPRVKWEHLKEYEFELPDLDKQRKLAEVLWAINDAVESYKKLLDATDKLVKARFEEMFGGNALVDLNYPVIQMDEVFNISSSKRILKSEWRDSGIPFLRVRDMVRLAMNQPADNDFFVSDELYASLCESDGIPQAGDIMVSATSTIGKCYEVKPGERFYYKDADILRFRKKIDIDSTFFMYCMKLPVLMNQIEATLGVTTVSHFLIARAKTLKVPMPPMEQQQKFAAFVHQTDKSKSELEQALSELTATYKRILSENLG